MWIDLLFLFINKFYFNRENTRLKEEIESLKRQLAYVQSKLLIMETKPGKLIEHSHLFYLNSFPVFDKEKIKEVEMKKTFLIYFQKIVLLH
jgi:hypothetical protein